MTLDIQLEEFRVKIPKLETRVLKLETTLDGLFTLLASMSSEVIKLKALTMETVSKHNILNGKVNELVAKSVIEDNDDAKNKEKD